MRRSCGWLLAALSLAPISGGCATSEGVRYVYQDGDFGVVGMPENSDAWPTHYRRRAEKLMEAHFPEGHEIVRAEEVVEGERTLKLEGSNSAELAPQLPAGLNPSQYIDPNEAERHKPDQDKGGEKDKDQGKPKERHREETLSADDPGRIGRSPHRDELG